MGAGKGVGKTLNGSKAALRLGGKAMLHVGVALAVSDITQVLVESMKDRHEFKEKLKQGIYDEKLAKRLNHAWTDSVLGRGNTDAILKACSRQGSTLKSSISCVLGAKDMLLGLKGAVKKGAI